MRYIVTSVVILGLMCVARRRRVFRDIYDEITIVQIVLGILYHVAYIGCVFYAVKLGLSAGVAAVILSIQPLATILMECVLDRKYPVMSVWAGVAICIAGTLLVANINIFDSMNYSPLPIVIALLGVLSISVATVIHGRFVSKSNLWPSLFVQFSTAAIVIAFLLYAGVEPLKIQFDLYRLIVVLFLVFITTLGSYVAMDWLIRSIHTNTYSLLFYLVPPAVFVMEYLIFGSLIEAIRLLGCFIILVGVYISIKNTAETESG